MGDLRRHPQAQRPDPETGKPDLERVAAFAAEHQETQRAFGFAILSMSPASFAHCTFFGIHAFAFEAPDTTKRWVRYRWVPGAGEATLTDDETRALGRDYLRDDLGKRLGEGPIFFELLCVPRRIRCRTKDVPEASPRP